MVGSRVDGEGTPMAMEGLEGIGRQYALEVKVQSPLVQSSAPASRSQPLEDGIPTPDKRHGTALPAAVGGGGG